MRKISVAEALRRAKFLVTNGQKEEAVKLYELVLSSFPQNKQAKQRLVELQKAPIYPSDLTLPQEIFNQLVDLYNQGKYGEVIIQAEELLENYPKVFMIWNLLGSAYNSTNNTSQAASAFRKVTDLSPSYADGHNNLGVVLSSQGEIKGAIQAFRKAIQINPDYAEAYYNMGNTFAKDRKHKEADKCYTKVISLSPSHAKAYNNLGISIKQQGKLSDAIKLFNKALSFDPKYDTALYNLGNSFIKQKRFEEAIDSYTKALRVNPGYESARTQKLHQQACICDWISIARDSNLIHKLGTKAQAVAPFPFLSLEDAPERHQLRSEIFSKKKFTHQPLLLSRKLRKEPKRIHVGYFSADFHNHATMYLMAKIFEIHNREDFKIFAYSFGPEKKDEMRSRLVKAVDRFTDVRNLSDLDIALLARQDKLDIAVDLKGHTEDSRSGIFAYRVSPIQINYLGYPGTMGTTFIDYIIADKIVIPEKNKCFYSEKIIYLPNSYQVNDNSRQISNCALNKSKAGLTTNGFVFCCFNNNYKITPVEFDIWMRLLGKVEESVLWLLKSNELAEKNLRNEAEKRGIDGRRLVFAEKVPHAAHLARHRQADLFLDTFNYNAHTTSSDALWAGLPVVTKLGESFASRVAASLLNAVDLPELITETLDGYEALALKLAMNEAYLREVKTKLSAKILQKPLFDTELFTKHLESGYRQAYQNYFDKNLPRTIYVQD